MKNLKPSEYPAGTYIVYDFDEYVKTNRFWMPLDDVTNHLTFREVDHFQDRGDKIEILAMPWSVVTNLVALIQAQWDINRNDLPSLDDILKVAIEGVSNEELKAITAS